MWTTSLRAISGSGIFIGDRSVASRYHAALRRMARDAGSAGGVNDQYVDLCPAGDSARDRE
jgi:hypothetical protein